jgi:3-methyladenine DNA glycosylase Tag
MTSERAVLAFAGFMVILSVILTNYVHSGFMWLTIFVGANLFQSAFTGFCPAGKIFQKLGFKSSEGSCC